MRLRSSLAVLVLSLAAASAGSAQPGLPAPAELERELGQRAATLAAAKESGDLTAVVAESRRLSALLLRLIAHLELAQGRPERASESLRQAHGIEPDPMTAYALGTVLLRRGEKMEAREVFDHLLAGAGGRPELHLLIGNAYAATSEVEETIREFEAAAEGNPGLFRAHLNLAYAHLLLNAGQSTPVTLAALRAALAVAPTSYEANYYLGHLESLEKRYAEAAEHLRAAAAAQPRSADPWLQLGLNAFAAGDLEQAETLLLKGVGLGEEHGEDVKLLSRAYGAWSRVAASRGDLETGARYFARARELEEKPAQDPPAAPPPGAEEARLAALRERHRELADVLASVFNDWGTAAARGGDPAQALRRYRDAERWNPSTPLLMRNLGLAALEAGDHEESVRALTAAAAAEPQDRSVQSLLAVALSSAERWAEAARAFDALGDVLFENPRTAYMWAAALARSGEPARAREVLARLRALPLPPPALEQLGELYREMGDHETALELFSEAQAR